MPATLLSFAAATYVGTAAAYMDAAAFYLRTAAWSENQTNIVLPINNFKYVNQFTPLSIQLNSFRNQLNLI